MASPMRGAAARRKGPQAPSVPGIERYWKKSFVGIALVLLIATVLYTAVEASREGAQARRQLGGGAASLARAAGDELARIRQRLEALESDPALREAFASGDAAALESARQQLARRLPSVLDIRMLAAEKTSSVEGVPDLSYAGLDLARQAAQTLRVTELEVHKVRQPDMHLAVATPVLVLGGGQAIGVVHLTLPLTVLPTAAALAGERGILRYRQAVRGEATVVERGESPPAREPDFVEPVPGSRLQVAAWLPENGAFGLTSALIAALFYLLVTAFVGAVLWLGHRDLRRDLLKASEGLKGMVDAAIDNRPPGEIKIALAELQPAREAIAAVLSLLKSAGALRGPAAGQEPEDLLRSSARVNEDSVEVEEVDAPNGLDGATARLARTGRERLSKGRSESDAREAGEIPAEIFRAYDIRGIADRQLTREIMYRIGRAIGSEALAGGDDRAVIGRDTRASSPGLATALTEGIRAAGCDVVDLGVVPTPLVYFACCHPDAHAGAMITGSHNPLDYNGVKPVLAGASADAEGIQGLRLRIQEGDLASGKGGYRTEDAIAAYRDFVEGDLALARHLKVVLDCGNATAAVVAPELFRALGCEVIELNCDLAAGMSEQVPDPANPELMRELADLVVREGADLGLAFDGDGDRLGVVDSMGVFVAADRVLMPLAADVLSRHPGTDVIFDVKCTRHLADEVRRAGGRPIMWRSGHAPLKAKLRNSGAMIAGELSGHIVFKERWFGFDDAIYAGARLLEVLSLDPRSSHEVFAALPGGLATPEIVLPMREGEPFQVMEQIMQLADRIDGVNLIHVDGLRAEFEHGWGLVRASNTQPMLTFRFEGDDESELEKIKFLFRRILDKAVPGIALPF